MSNEPSKVGVKKESETYLKKAIYMGLTTPDCNDRQQGPILMVRKSGDHQLGLVDYPILYKVL